MGFVEAVNTCLGKFITIKGRAARPEYWWFYLFAILVTGAASIVDGVLFGFDVEDQPGNHPFTLIASFVVFFPLLAVGWRRMHDTGRPGWIILLPQFLILAGFATFLVTTGIFGLMGRAVDAPSDVQANVDRVIATYMAFLFYIAIIVAVLLKLWWLTRPGDDHQNEYGPIPTR